MSESRVRENRTHGSMRRGEATQPVGPARTARNGRLSPTLHPVAGFLLLVGGSGMPFVGVAVSGGSVREAAIE